MTLCETRPGYLGSPGEWSDRNGRWHEYHEGGRFRGTAVQLLSEIDDDPTAIFKG